MRSPRTTTKSKPRSLQLEKARAQQRRPNAARNNNKKNKTQPRHEAKATAHRGVWLQISLDLGALAPVIMCCPLGLVMPWLVLAIWSPRNKAKRLKWEWASRVALRLCNWIVFTMKPDIEKWVLALACFYPSLQCLSSSSPDFLQHQHTSLKTLIKEDRQDDPSSEKDNHPDKTKYAQYSDNYLTTTYGNAGKKVYSSLPPKRQVLNGNRDTQFFYCDLHI